MSTVAKDHVFELSTSGLSVPTVFKHMIDHWKCKDWSLTEWANTLPEKLQFRIGSTSNTGTPLWEGDSQYLEGTLLEFLEWSENLACCRENAFADFDPNTSWAYAGYKYMAELYKHNEDLMKVVDWSNFGFEGRNGRDSTLWIGSKRANTPCHYDTYGYNLVAQLHGKKRWIMFPPNQSMYMQATRIPYEESSVYCGINVGDPQLGQFSSFSNTTPYIVHLEPGDVLFVPRHWWHYVECLETSLSINTWLEIPDDEHSRLEEAITKAIMSSFVTVYKTEEWLNPNEELDDAEFNIMCLSQALTRSLLSDRKSSADSKLTRPMTCNQNKEMDISKDESNTKRIRLTMQDVKNVPSASALMISVEPTSFSNYLSIIRENSETVNQNLITKTIEDETDKPNSPLVVPVGNTSESSVDSTSVEAENQKLQKLLVNSICHPDIISQIAKQMKKDWTVTA